MPRPLAQMHPDDQVGLATVVHETTELNAGRGAGTGTGSGASGPEDLSLGRVIAQAMAQDAAPEGCGPAA